MTAGSKLFILWAIFLAHALVIAILTMGDSSVADIAILFAFIFGVPISLIMAVLNCRKRLDYTIALGSALIGCSAVVGLYAFQSNPFVIALLVMLSAGVIWVVVPVAPIGDGYSKCSHCGYSLLGLGRNKKCPECGEDLSESVTR